MRVSFYPLGKHGLVEKRLSVRSNDPYQPSLSVPVVATVVKGSPSSASAKLESVLFGREECARCHADPAKDRHGAALYDAVCGMCHGSLPSYASSQKLASLDGKALRAWIADGKNKEGMPGYSTKVQGPLTDTQIDSLVDAIREAR